MTVWLSQMDEVSIGMTGWVSWWDKVSTGVTVWLSRMDEVSIGMTGWVGNDCCTKVAATSVPTIHSCMDL